MDPCAAGLGCPAALSIGGDSTFASNSQPWRRAQLAIFCFDGSLPGDCQARVPAIPMDIATRKTATRCKAHPMSEGQSFAFDAEFTRNSKPITTHNSVTKEGRARRRVPGLIEGI